MSTVGGAACRTLGDAYRKRPLSESASRILRKVRAEQVPCHSFSPTCSHFVVGCLRLDLGSTERGACSVRAERRLGLEASAPQERNLLAIDSPLELEPVTTDG